ncbi:MAG: PEP-CTERM sorting domain-containing protein [Aquabacterium sp.]|uniref:PEP-CTERM sorting domain-containing protein n=1 Tax=Aquabacterium sp. TaxID=1872578 RepID=UPI0025BA100F|nr:PEP-CTERM sorting domain-containing protein [Aquabacterium sp.]MBI3382437.1 PEP-CTERM sorting domain-containing protein [Aquabacterium sp.]
MPKPIHAFARTWLAALSLATFTLPALAHVSYTGRDLGTYDGLTAAGTTISNQAVSGNYGWADAADADWGDSHKAKWFTFTLNNDALVTLTVSANASATSTSIGGLLPGFSVYKGIAPTSVDPLNPGISYLSYDTSTASTAYKASLPFAVEGVWNAVGDFAIGNDFGALNTLSFVGYAVDGEGTVQGGMADGLRDGRTSKTLQLGAGTYSLLVGGADYDAQLSTNPHLAAAYGMSVGIQVSSIPEPGTLGLSALGLGALSLAVRRRAPR